MILTRVGHPPCDVAEWIFEAVPVNYCNLVGPYAVGLRPHLGTPTIHLTDGIQVCLVA